MYFSKWYHGNCFIPSISNLNANTQLVLLHICLWKKPPCWAHISTKMDLDFHINSCVFVYWLEVENSSAVPLKLHGSWLITSKARISNQFIQIEARIKSIPILLLIFKVLMLWILQNFESATLRDLIYLNSLWHCFWCHTLKHIVDFAVC